MIRSTGYVILLILCFFALCFLLRRSNDSGLVVKMCKTKGQDRSRNICYLQNDKLKIVTDDKTLVFTEGHLSLIDHKKKMFWRGSIRDFDKRMEEIRLDSASSYYATRGFFYRNLTMGSKIFLQRLNELITGRMHDSLRIPKIVATPDFCPVAGYASRKYEVRQAGGLAEEVWVAEGLKGYLNYELDLELYKSFLDSFLQYSKSGLRNHLDPFMAVVENGFPMRIKVYGKDETAETIVESLAKRKFDESTFQIPEGYRHMDLEFLAD